MMNSYPYNLDDNPAALTVFRTENILEEICSHLEFADLKQFRLVLRICNNEGRRALIKRDQHWMVVKSKDNDGWQLELDPVLRNLEETTAASNKKLLGWIFKRLVVEDWKKGSLLGEPYFIRKWGHYLRKIHLKAQEYTAFSPCLLKTIHELLSVHCPNLEEMMVFQKHLSLISRACFHLEFSWPLLKLKCLRIKYEWERVFPPVARKALQTFYTRLVLAAGSSLEEFDIHYGGDDWDYWIQDRLLNDIISLNKGPSNFQSLKTMTLKSSADVVNLSRTVQKCFPKLTKLKLDSFISNSFDQGGRNPASYRVFPEAFPALKCLMIEFIDYDYIYTGKIVYFLRHFPNLEVLTVLSNNTRYRNEWPEIPPVYPTCQSLRSFTLKTKDRDLRILQGVVKIFPNLEVLDLLGFGTLRFERYHDIGGGRYSDAIREPEHSFAELIDTISSSSSLKELKVTHAFHTPSQLGDAIQCTTNLTSLEKLILVQIAHDDDDPEQDFKVSLYLNSSAFQYILNCNSVKRLKSVQLLNFRFGTTRKEVEEDAASKCGHVQFGTMCPCGFKSWICCQNGVKV